MTDAVDVNDEAVQMIPVVDRRAPNPYRNPFLILIIAVCLSLLSNSFSNWLTWHVANDTNVIVRDVNFRNSPANQKQQQAFLEEIILRVDCNARKAIEEALNEIAADNPGFLHEINITETRCKNASSTTSKP